MDNIIEIKELTKKYGGKTALHGIDLNLKKGKIIGILGPNGSGKTTLIKLLTGLLHPTSGQIKIDGYDPSVYTKSIISYLPDRNALYNWMKVDDAIKMFMDFYEDFD